MRQNIVIVESDPLYAEKLESLVSRQEGYSVSARFDSALLLLDSARALAAKGGSQWDLILVNLCLLDMSGIEAVHRLKCILPQIPVIIYSALETPAAIVRAVRPGSDGQLLMETSTRELQDHLRSLVVSVPAEKRPGVQKRYRVSGLRPTTLAPRPRVIKRKHPA
jgi:two-component system OmpR family response regulator